MLIKALITGEFGASLQRGIYCRSATECIHVILLSMFSSLHHFGLQWTLPLLSYTWSTNKHWGSQCYLYKTVYWLCMDLNCFHKILFFFSGSLSDLFVVKCYIQVLQILLVQLPHPGKHFLVCPGVDLQALLYMFISCQVHGTFLLAIK